MPTLLDQFRKAIESAVSGKSSAAVNRSPAVVAARSQLGHAKLKGKAPATSGRKGLFKHN